MAGISAAERLGGARQKQAAMYVRSSGGHAVHAPLMGAGRANPDVVEGVSSGGYTLMDTAMAGRERFGSLHDDRVLSFLCCALRVEA